MTPEVITFVGRVLVLFFGLTIVSFSPKMVTYHLRRRAYLQSRAQAIDLAAKLSKDSVEKLVKISPHFRAEEISFGSSDDIGNSMDAISKIVGKSN